MAAAQPSLLSFLSFFGALEEEVDPGSDPAAASSPEAPFSFFLRPSAPRLLRRRASGGRRRRRARCPYGARAERTRLRRRRLRVRLRRIRRRLRLSLRRRVLPLRRLRAAASSSSRGRVPRRPWPADAPLLLGSEPRVVPWIPSRLGVPARRGNRNVRPVAFSPPASDDLPVRPSSRPGCSSSGASRSPRLRGSEAPGRPPRPRGGLLAPPGAAAFLLRPRRRARTASSRRRVGRRVGRLLLGGLFEDSFVWRPTVGCLAPGRRTDRVRRGTPPLSADLWVPFPTETETTAGAAESFPPPRLIFANASTPIFSAEDWN